MMQNLPLYIELLFIAAVLFVAISFFMATGRSRPVLSIMAIWLLATGLLSYKGVFHEPDILPNRFILIVLPPMLTVLFLSFSNQAFRFRERCDLRWLTYLHAGRIGIEVVLYFLFLHQLVPLIMTWKEYNVDILAGLSAPFIAYFGLDRKIIPRKVVLWWNIACVASLLHIVMVAILSAPFPFQQYGFAQPNRAIFYFPFTWLPCFVVPLVLLCHLISIRKLMAAPSK